MKFFSWKIVFIVLSLFAVLTGLIVMYADSLVDCTTCCQYGTMVDSRCCAQCGNCPLSNGKTGCANYPNTATSEWD